MRSNDPNYLTWQSDRLAELERRQASQAGVSIAWPLLWLIIAAIFWWTGSLYGQAAERQANQETQPNEGP